MISFNHINYVREYDSQLLTISTHGYFRKEGIASWITEKIIHILNIILINLYLSFHLYPA